MKHKDDAGDCDSDGDDDYNDDNSYDADDADDDDINSVQVVTDSKNYCNFAYIYGDLITMIFMLCF